MTVDSPQATLGLLRNTNVKMFGHFHNYANSPTQAMRDHSLQPDLSYLQTSPPSLYEPEFITCSSPQMALQSPCDTGQCDVTSPTLSDNGELQPQFEQSLVKGEWESMKLYDGLDQEDSLWPNLASAPTAPPPLVPLCSVQPRIETMMKVNRKDALNGPTLAQLNCDTSVMFDDIENIIKQDLLFSKAAWKQPQNTTTCISSPVFSVASSLSPASFTSTVASTASSGNSATVLTTQISGILSMLPGNTTVTPQPTLTTPVSSTPLSSVSPSKSSPPVESFLITSTPFTSRFSKPQVTPVSTRGRKRSLEEEGDECNSSVDRKWEEIKEFLHSPTTAKDERLFAYDERTLKEIKKEPKTPGTCPALEPARDIRLPLDSVKYETAKEIKVEPQDIAYTPNEDLMSEDEGFEDSENSDDEDNLHIADHSDSDDEDQSLSIEDFIVGSKKHKRYFWQYNTQSKGPKGKRLCHSFTTEDPHKLDDFEDPVFDPDLNQNQYKHHGRARKGDGNDIRPSPLKLYQIGNELKKLNKFMNDLTPVSEMPSTTRQNTRKVKNKFASRACRLKKKAQHEANKLKLYGLEEEHHQLITLLQLVKEELCWCIKDPDRKARGSLFATYETLVQKHLTVMVGGHTADYVNGVLEQLAHGNSSGGIKMEDME